MKKVENCDKHRSSCAISVGLDFVGDKWSLLILRDLMFTEKRSYGEFQSSEEKIATNILASRLAGLEENGIIIKRPDPNNGRRNLYFLTQKGIDLLPVIVELREWTERYTEGLQSCADAIKMTATNKYSKLEAFKKELVKKHLQADTTPA